MSLAKHSIDELSSEGSSQQDLEVRSEIEDHIDPDAYQIEQESAKLQAEVHKLSKELEDLMSSRKLSEAILKTEEPLDEGREEASFEEREDRIMSQSASLEKELRSDFRDQKARIPKRESASPSFPPMPPRALESIQKSDSFGLMGPRPPPTEKKRPSSETRAAPSGWRRVNEMLQQHGFRAVPLRGDGEAVDCDLVCETLREVLTDFSHCADSLEKAEKRMKAMEGETTPLQDEITRLKARLDEERSLHQEDRFEADRLTRDAERQISVLKGKLETAQMQCRQRDQLIEQLKEHPPAQEADQSGEAIGTDRDKAIFKRFFGHEAKRGMDEKVLGLISAYEERRRRHTPEPRSADVSRSASLHETIKDLRTQLDMKSRDIDSLEKHRSSLTEENARLKSQMSKPMSESSTSEVLAKALETLQLKSEKQLPIALKKMQQVIRALPGLENFIRSISSEVLTGDVESNSVENVLPTIRTWKQKALMWEAANSARMQICHLLGLEVSSDFADILKSLRSSKEPEIVHFRTLFEIGPDEDVLQSMNQVFLFVHEMKGLLQYSREVMRVESSVGVQGLVDRIKYRLQT